MISREAAQKAIAQHERVVRLLDLIRAICPAEQLSPSEKVASIEERITKEIGSDPEWFLDDVREWLEHDR